MIQIADKWTIIDIFFMQISEETIQHIKYLPPIYSDFRKHGEHLYPVTYLDIEYTGHTGEDSLPDIVNEELLELRKLAEANDAFYFRIIYT